jgi:hypothetical protein
MQTFGLLVMIAQDRWHMLGIFTGKGIISMQPLIRLSMAVHILEVELRILI